MFCPNCGANIPGSSEVCPECGTEIVVAPSSGDADDGLFIVADDVRDIHTPSGPVMAVPECEENFQQYDIIEADEDELPENETDKVPVFFGDDTEIRIVPDDVTGNGSVGPDSHDGDDLSILSSSEGNGSCSEEDGDALFFTPPCNEIPEGGSLPGPHEGEVSVDVEGESRSSESHLYADRFSPSRRRPVIGGLAVAILVVLGIAILVYGLPGQGPTDTRLVVPTLLPAAVPDTTPTSVTGTSPTWTPSENLLITVSDYGGGYKVEIDGGLEVNEVETILLTVEDKGGPHTMEWVYPSRHEHFYMARDAYNGTASATEHVTATATFTDGKKEVVFSGDL